MALIRVGRMAIDATASTPTPKASFRGTERTIVGRDNGQGEDGELGACSNELQDGREWLNRSVLFSGKGSLAKYETRWVSSGNRSLAISSGDNDGCEALFRSSTASSPPIFG